MIELFGNRDDDNKVLEEKQKENYVAEVGKAVEMRQLSMETLAESRKRKSESKDGEKHKRRVSTTGSETIAYSQKKSDVEAQLKRKELRLRQIEADERKQQQNNIVQELFLLL